MISLEHALVSKWYFRVKGHHLYCVKIIELSLLGFFIQQIRVYGCAIYFHLCSQNGFKNKCLIVWKVIKVNNRYKKLFMAKVYNGIFWLPLNFVMFGIYLNCSQIFTTAFATITQLKTFTHNVRDHLRNYWSVIKVHNITNSLICIQRDIPVGKI